MSAIRAAIWQVLFGLSLLYPWEPSSATESDQCHEAAKRYGAMMMASIVCNFPERPAITKLKSILYEVCQPKSDDNLKELARPGVEEGGQIFYRDQEKYGHQKACSEWDQYIRTTQ